MSICDWLTHHPPFVIFKVYVRTRSYDSKNFFGADTTEYYSVYQDTAFYDHVKRWPTFLVLIGMGIWYTITYPIWITAFIVGGILDGLYFLFFTRWGS